jgi:hypothetical protein
VGVEVCVNVEMFVREKVGVAEGVNATVAEGVCVGVRVTVGESVGVKVGV